MEWIAKINKTRWIIQDPEGTYVTLRNEPSFYGPEPQIAYSWVFAKMFDLEDVKKYADILQYNGKGRPRKNYNVVEINCEIGLAKRFYELPDCSADNVAYESYYVIQAPNNTSEENNYVTLTPAILVPTVKYTGMWWDGQKFFDKKLATRVCDLLQYNGARKARKDYKLRQVITRFELKS